MEFKIKELEEKLKQERMLSEFYQEICDKYQKILNKIIDRQKKTANKSNLYPVSLVFDGFLVLEHEIT